MFKRIGIAAALAAVLAVPAQALDCCSQMGPEVAGICITALEGGGTVQLGDRVLRPGDVLTAAQAAQLTFCPAEQTVSQTVQIRYLPILEDSVAPEAVMTVSIRGRENQCPVAEDSALETYKNLETTGKLKVTDPEGDAMTYTLTRPPKRGTVTIGEDGGFTYSPKKNKVGIDSFTYTAADPSGKTSREATVTITILKPSDAARYTDTAGTDCCFAAEWMRNTGIFVGETLDGNACFSPEKAVTQGEFLTMLVKTLNLPLDEADSGSPQTPAWLQPYLAAAARAGLEISAFYDEMDSADAAALACTALGTSGLTLPSGTLTRAEAAQLLYQVSKLLPDSAKAKAWQ